MLLADNNIIPPSNWEHSPELANDADETVALLLSKGGIVPPK